jgi:hypothetical protein
MKLSSTQARLIRRHLFFPTDDRLLSQAALFRSADLKPGLRVRLWSPEDWYRATVLTGKTRRMREDEVGALVDHVRVRWDHSGEPAWLPMYRLEPATD